MFLKKKGKGIDPNVYLIVIGVLLALLAGTVVLLTLQRAPGTSGEPTGNVQTYPPPPGPGETMPEVPSPVAESGDVAVNWRLMPVEVRPYDVAMEIGVSVDDLIWSSTQEHDQPRYYKVGTVASGEYNLTSVYAVKVPCLEMCITETYMYFIGDYRSHRLINLPAYGGPLRGTILLQDYYGPGRDIVAPPARVAIDAPDLRLEGADAPARVTIAGSGVTLTKSEYSPQRFVLSTETQEIGRTTDGRTLYTMEGSGCLLLLLPNGMYVQYDLPLPFLTERRIPELDWSDSVADVGSVDYTFTDTGGCGAMNCYAVRTEEEVRPSQRLLLAGRTSSGDPFYVLKNERDPELLKVYDDGTMYVPEGETKPTYEQFLAKRPVFYWKDQLGRWIRFVRQDVLPAVECGKPVVYLYPQKEMPVSVRVGLKGTMAVSEPPHGTRGWKVTARPDGYVVNAADGKTYPNLFWEGTGVNYKTPAEGFVIKRIEADVWLTKTLAMIGFTDRESAEFREFWVPRLPTTPYVFITFVPQADFDRDAPLVISPRPDKVFRVFMETRGLQAPVSVKPLALPKIERTGFTVVEWGGALRK